MSSQPKNVFDYDVAISFAGDDRPVAEKLANALASRGLRVFYDRFETADLLGRNLIDHLSEIYGKRSKFCLMVISRSYVEKEWAKLERQAAQDRVRRGSDDYVLPVRIDDVEVPGLLSSVGFIDFRSNTPDGIADLITNKLTAAGITVRPPNIHHPGTVLFELGSERRYSPPRGLADAWWVVSNLMTLVQNTGVSLVGWELSPLRIELYAQRSAFDLLRNALFSGDLDAATQQEWVRINLLDSHRARTPEQAPIMRIPDFDEACSGDTIVCHLASIEGYEREADEAKAIVGQYVTDYSQCCIYVTKQENDLYVHSNFVKPGAEYATKIAVEGRLSLFLLFLNCVLWKFPDRALLEELKLIHQTKVRYFVNRTKIQKGNFSFYAGACNVEFVTPAPTGRVYHHTL